MNFNTTDLIPYMCEHIDFLDNCMLIESCCDVDGNLIVESSGNTFSMKIASVGDIDKRLSHSLVAARDSLFKIGKPDNKSETHGGTEIHRHIKKSDYDIGFAAATETDLIQSLCELMRASVGYQTIKDLIDIYKGRPDMIPQLESELYERVKNHKFPNELANQLATYFLTSRHWTDSELDMLSEFDLTEGNIGSLSAILDKRLAGVNRNSSDPDISDYQERMKFKPVFVGLFNRLYDNNIKSEAIEQVSSNIKQKMNPATVPANKEQVGILDKLSDFLSNKIRTIASTIRDKTKQSTGTTNMNISEEYDMCPVCNKTMEKDATDNGCDCESMKESVDTCVMCEKSICMCEEVCPECNKNACTCETLDEDNNDLWEVVEFEDLPDDCVMEESDVEEDDEETITEDASKKPLRIVAHAGVIVKEVYKKKNGVYIKKKAYRAPDGFKVVTHTDNMGITHKTIKKLDPKEAMTRKIAAIKSNRKASNKIKRRKSFKRFVSIKGSNVFKHH